MTPISILVADDEPLARERLTTLLAGRPELSVIAECGDGEEAAARMARDRPDLAFLDVQMPELDGFGALEAAAPWHVPEVVFVTAYDEYALRAFEAGAIDYLLKPFDRPRFERALHQGAGATRDTGARSGDTGAARPGGRGSGYARAAGDPGRAAHPVRRGEHHRVDRSGRQLCAAAGRGCDTLAAGADARTGASARSEAFRPHPSLLHRECRCHCGARAHLAWGVSGEPQGWNGPHEQQDVQ